MLFGLTRFARADQVPTGHVVGSPFVPLWLPFYLVGQEFAKQETPLTDAGYYNIFWVPEPILVSLDKHSMRWHFEMASDRSRMRSTPSCGKSWEKVGMGKLSPLERPRS